MTNQIEMPIQTKRLPEPPWGEGTQCYRLVCDGCGRGIDHLQVGMVHEILHNIEDRFPEHCGKMVIVAAEGEGEE